MNLESLDDDNFTEFKGGTLEIKDASVNLNTESVININETSGSNLINIPKQLWNCNNNQLVNKLSDVSDNVQDYFTFRDEVVEKAVLDCVENLIHPEDDGELVATFLLTEITSWDAEKERLLILTQRTIFSVKYDFIALKQLEHKRIGLETLDSIVVGDLVYPSTSLVPRLNGLASGVSNVMKGCLLDNQQQRFFDNTTNLFQPRDRKTHGIRIHWKGDAPLAFTQRWNPFNSDVPYITFTSHPLCRHADSLNDNQRSTFSVDEFYKQLIEAVEHTNKTNCLIHHKDILLQTYVGLGSFIYNRNALGFFKVRGKFSF